MSHLRSSIDPLWQCLCPLWSSSVASRLTVKRLRVGSAINTFRPQRPLSSLAHGARNEHRNDHKRNERPKEQITRSSTKPSSPRTRRAENNSEVREERAFEDAETPELYTRLRSLAGRPETFNYCKRLVHYLVRERRQKPSLPLYNALILSNASHDHGSAWRIHALLAEMHSEGIQLDMFTCHAILKVLAVHPDHLLRTDVLEYMRTRWFQISNEGAHDVTAGLLREGLYEQALARIEAMQHAGMRVEPWLEDTAIYQLCDSGEIEEAYRIIRKRHERMETDISRSVWFTLLDRASAAHHHAATKMMWYHRVRPGYLNPPAGVCLNVLVTASKVGDAALATDVFTHLADRGLAHHRHHYDLMMTTYLGGPKPDVERAVSLLSVMEGENLKPSNAETRVLFACLRNQPRMTEKLLSDLRSLHAQSRRVPIAALNLLIECFVEQKNLPQAMKVYKMIHTFGSIEDGAQSTFANIDTINMLLKGCRLADPPDESLASFLVSEMLALRIQPNDLTYDRLILVSVQACLNSVAKGDHSHTRELLDWAHKHLQEMHSSGFIPRQGTLRKLAMTMASQEDERCWDVLQFGEENADSIEGWRINHTRIRAHVETAWSEACESPSGVVDKDGSLAVTP